jgi:hypothetical protein
MSLAAGRQVRAKDAPAAALAATSLGSGQVNVQAPHSGQGRDSMAWRS